MAGTPISMIAGNWKMNMLRAEGFALADKLAEGLDPIGRIPVDVAICPPLTLAPELCTFLAATLVVVGGQDCSPLENGAHTGDVSANMQKHAGMGCCIVGHSERRADHGEDDILVCAKARAVLASGMTAIICIGETETQRDAGETIDVVTDQLAGSVPDEAINLNTVIAYEPVWAIGTGKTPTLEEIGEVHAKIRELLYDRFDYDGAAMRILYGGSVNADNAYDILRVKNVNGALVGGASLDPEAFLKIIRDCPAPPIPEV
jgi:triosephosphate isomerase